MFEPTHVRTFEFQMCSLSEEFGNVAVDRTDEGWWREVKRLWVGGYVIYGDLQNIHVTLLCPVCSLIKMVRKVDRTKCNIVHVNTRYYTEHQPM